MLLYEEVGLADGKYRIAYTTEPERWMGGNGAEDGRKQSVCMVRSEKSL